MRIARATSLLPGRHNAPLTKEEVTRAYNTFFGMDAEVAREAVRFEEGATSGFRTDQAGQNGEIVFGPDIYPGRAVANPNASLSMTAAVAHELSHFHRWRDKTELQPGPLRHLDEALTSLQAVLRYHGQLTEHDRRQLVEDALQRLQLHALEQTKIAGG